ncbi:hypothetical protein [Plantactinospora sp. BB1]|uniref:hypothetical protein n=1 Tax=Plantactinospora sp. BB1 TaxID=2071627 RepID=UPI00131EEC78|nr:hypothetical protein [Plantactinospora sp. BB1]
MTSRFSPSVRAAVLLAVTAAVILIGLLLFTSDPANRESDRPVPVPEQSVPAPEQRAPTPNRQVSAPVESGTPAGDAGELPPAPEPADR